MLPATGTPDRGQGGQAVGCHDQIDGASTLGRGFAGT